MPYNIRILGQSGQSLFGNQNEASQYGDPDVAATAILQGHLVCPGRVQGPVPPPGLSLSSPGTKQSGVAARAASQSSFHRQPASPLDPTSPSPLPPAAPTHQPSSRRGPATFAGTNFRSSLQRNPKRLFDAIFTSS